MKKEKNRIRCSVVVDSQGFTRYKKNREKPFDLISKKVSKKLVSTKDERSTVPVHDPVLVRNKEPEEEVLNYQSSRKGVK